MRSRSWSGVLPAALASVCLSTCPAWSESTVLLRDFTRPGTHADGGELAMDAGAPAETKAPESSVPQGSRRVQAGIAFVAAGALTFAAGLLVDFSPHFSPQASSGTELSGFDSANVALMAVGGGMVVVGAVLIAGAPRGSSTPSVGLEMAGDRPVLAYRQPF